MTKSYNLLGGLALGKICNYYYRSGIEGWLKMELRKLSSWLPWLNISSKNNRRDRRGEGYGNSKHDSESEL